MVVLLVSTLLFVSGARAGATAPTSGLNLISQTGDYVGQGLAYSVPTVTFDPNDSNYSAGEEEFVAIGAAENWAAVSQPRRGLLFASEFGEG
jgi:hypothetical protein